MKCRKCGESIIGEPVFLDCYNNKTKRPTCLDCYERSIRNGPDSKKHDVFINVEQEGFQAFAELSIDVESILGADELALFTRKVLGFTDESIALSLGVSRQRVSRRIGQIRKKIREAMP